MNEEDDSTERCLEKLEKAKKDWKVKKLIDSMEKLGCQLPEKFFTCKSCGNDEAVGGFIPVEKQVVLCGDVIAKHDIP